MFVYVEKDLGSGDDWLGWSWWFSPEEKECFAWVLEALGGWGRSAAGWGKAWAGCWWLELQVASRCEEHWNEEKTWRSSWLEK